MKKRIFSFILILHSFLLFSQVPEGFNYQAIIRNPDGTVKKDENISLNLYIKDIEGNIVFEETHEVMSGGQGLVSLVIGSQKEGLANIDWSKGSYFIHMKIDGEEMGSSQLLSVPYSMYSNKSKYAYETESTNNYFLIDNTPRINLFGNNLIYPCIQYNDCSTTSIASSTKSQLDFQIRAIYENPEKISLNGKEALEWTILNNKNTKISTRCFCTICCEIDSYFSIMVHYDAEKEENLFLMTQNGSSGNTIWRFSDGLIQGEDNNPQARATVLYKNKKAGIIIWQIHIKDLSSFGNHQTIGFSNNSEAPQKVIISNLTGSFNPINIHAVYEKIADKNDSYLRGKNCMIFGDSNLHGAIGYALMEQLGCNIYKNGAGGRAMKYRSQDSNWDWSWLYHWDRRAFIQECKNNGTDISAFIFYVSYNDGSGGGKLDEEAIQAVLDNYPAIGDNQGSISIKQAKFNALTEQERKDIFSYKQTFAAYIQQIINLYPEASIYLTTMLYAPSTDNDNPAVQREKDKKVKQAINADIQEIADWFGLPVIDTYSAATYYYGNMVQQGTTDNIHFNEKIGYRIGYFSAKEICKRTLP